MHASIWKFTGDPDDLVRRWDALLAEIPPFSLGLHLCLRGTDGITVLDTCPSSEAFEAFAGGEHFRSLRERHGLPEPARVDDFPVHVAIVDGSAV